MERTVPVVGEARKQSATAVAPEERTPVGAEVLALTPREPDEETTEPWAEGACRFDLVPEEWRLVCDAPLLSFLLVAATDDQVHPWERKALVEALKAGRRSSSKVLRLACVELYRQRASLLGALASSELRQERLTEASRLLTQKLGRDEAERFKEGLLWLGRRVAASNGSLLASWGWFSRAERGALARLAVLLDAGHAEARQA
jgi:hypothetical protein